MLFLAGLLGLMAVGSIAVVMPIVEEGEDSDAVPSENNADQEKNPLGDILSGLDVDDVLTGSGGDDQINGYGGDDIVDGAAGDDDLHGGSGADQIHAGDGDDVLHGGGGQDTLSGGDGDDSLFGHADDDTLFGDTGDDSMNGGDGDDALHGGLGDDVLAGGEGSDSLFGGWGDDVLSGVDDVPTPNGSIDQGHVDYLNGGGGDDIILAGQDDIITAGEGTDTMIFGDWIEEDQAATVMDYNANEDSLILVWDDHADQDPDEDNDQTDALEELAQGPQGVLRHDREGNGWRSSPTRPRGPGSGAHSTARRAST